LSLWSHVESQDVQLAVSKPAFGGSQLDVEVSVALKNLPKNLAVVSDVVLTLNVAVVDVHHSVDPQQAGQ
jgi:hypothetical protein